MRMRDVSSDLQSAAAVADVQVSDDTRVALIDDDGGVLSVACG